MLSYLTFSNRSDNEIVKHLSESGINRRKAEDQLFSSYTYLIHTGMEKYGLREDEAFDAYSDTILSAIDTISRGLFQSRSSIKTWVFKVFNNKCVDILRKNTTNKSSVNHTAEISEGLMRLSDTSKSIIQELVERCDYEEMKRKLSELGESCRSLLTLFADGYSDKEIASAMSYKSPDVAKTSRLRCLEKLRSMYMQIK
jgi:RNA polymerase sigma-70 factor (ECF subfamily)